MRRRSWRHINIPADIVPVSFRRNVPVFFREKVPAHRPGVLPAERPGALPGEKDYSFLGNEYEMIPPAATVRLNNEETLEEHEGSKGKYSFLFL